eukprot:symbB.v1.2.024221.t1/scaffold2276.1/size83569/1
MPLICPDEEPHEDDDDELGDDYRLGRATTHSSFLKKPTLEFRLTTALLVVRQMTCPSAPKVSRPKMREDATLPPVTRVSR